MRTLLSSSVKIVVFSIVYISISWIFLVERPSFLKVAASLVLWTGISWMVSISLRFYRFDIFWSSDRISLYDSVSLLLLVYGMISFFYIWTLHLFLVFCVGFFLDIGFFFLFISVWLIFYLPLISTIKLNKKNFK